MIGIIARNFIERVHSSARPGGSVTGAVIVACRVRTRPLMLKAFTLAVIRWDA
jgi:multidrug efflux pump subunit AcrB